MKAKFLKRTVSAVLAGVMAVPATGFSIIPAFATETSTNSDKGTKADYVADFGSVKNGKITFAGDKAAAAKNFKAGETVKVKLTPDDGYEVKSFTISDASSGEKLAEKETTDDVFSFAMPSMNITLTGEFSKTGDGAADASEKKSDDTAAKAEKAEKDAEKSVSKDASDTTEYIKNGLSDSAVSKADKTASKEVSGKPASDIKITSEASNGLTPVKHQLTVDYLLADSDKVSKNATIDSVWKDKKKVLAQVESNAQLYSVKGNENAYVAFTDAGRMNGVGKATYADFTNGDSKKPKSYNDKVTYDKSTGIVYIPRSLFVENGKEKQNKVVAQLLVPYDTDSSDLNGIRVSIENHNSKVKETAKSQTVTGRSFDVTTTIPVATKETAKNLDLSKVNIYINDSEVPAQFAKGEYFYDTKTGELTFKGMPASIYSVKVVINGTTAAEKIAETIAAKTFAGNTTEKSPGEIKSRDDLLALQNVGLSSDSNLPVGGQITFNTTAYYNYSVNYLMKNHKNVYNDILDYYYYCYYCDSSSSVASKDWGSILGSSGLQRMTEVHPQDQAYNEVYSYAFQLPKSAGALRGSNGAVLNFGGDADWPMTYLPLARANANQASGVLNPDTYKNGKSVSVTARVLDSYQKSPDYRYIIIGFTMNDGTGTQPAQGVYKLRLASSSQPGYVSVQASSDMNSQVHIPGGYYSLKGARYGVYELNPDLYRSEKEVAVITTDENGYGVNSDASAKHMRAGMTYYVKELGTHPSPGHGADTNVYSVVAVSSKGAANADAPRAESKEPYLKDPLGNLLKKYDKADPTADLSGAEFKLTYYGSKNIAENAVGGAQAEKSWVFRTNRDGVIDYKPEYKVSGDNLWDHNELHLGTYTLQEIKAPIKYTTKGKIVLTNGHEYNLRNPFYFRIQENGTTGVENVDNHEDAFTKETDTNGHSVFIKVYEVRKRGKFSVHKLDKDSNTGEAQGDADSMKWSGKVYASQDHTWVDLNNNEDVDKGEVFQKDQEVFSFETDDNGQYTTPNFIFGYGAYYIKEVSHPTGYKTSNQILRFNITEDNQTVEALDDANKKLTDEIFRGAFNFTKFDADSNTATPQGDATLKDAHFTVINSSKHYVYVNGRRYEKNAEVLTFSTNDKAQYSSADRLLPYGTYTIRETAAPTGYLNSTVRHGVMETTFSIRNDGERVNVTGIKDPVMRGKITLKKNNADVHNDQKANIASGNASFEGAEFAIINRSANAVYVDVNNDGNYSDNERFAPGATIETLRTDKNGYASTPDAHLPYGTYDVKETKAPEGYLVDNNFRGSVTIKTGLTVRGENQNVDLTWSAADPNHTFYDAIKRGQIKIKKNNADVHSDGDAVRAQGDSSLKGAEYTIYNKSKSYVWVDTNENGRFDAGERYEPNQAVKTIVTNEEGYAQTPEKYLPYGSYTIKETKAPEGYLLDEIRGAKTSLDFTISEEGQVITKYWSASNTEDTMYDAAPRGKVKIQKNNADVHSDDKASTASGNASFKGAEYTIYNKSKSYVWVDTNHNGTYEANEKFQPNAAISVLTIGDDGKAETPDKYLPYGTYEIRETKAPEGYLINDNFRNSVTSKTIQIRSEGQVVDLTWSKSNAENTFYDAIKRGQIKIKKNNADVHSDSDAVKAQGDSSLKGAEYTIYNKSKSYVWVDTNENGRFDSGERYEPNQAVKTIVTDGNGYAQTPEKYLPYGSYMIKETKAPEGYLLDEIRGAKTSLNFTISEEGQVITKYWSASNTEDTMYDAAPRGKVKIQKNNADVHSDDKASTASGNASFKGAEYTIYNKSKSYVWVDTNHNGTYEANEKFQPNASISVLTIGDNGKAETPDKYLPYGTYEIRETKAPEGYLINDNFRNSVTSKTIQIRSEGQVVDLTWSKSNAENTFYDAIKRGQIKIKKNNADVHSDSEAVKAQGDSSLKGAEYTIYNKSKSYVWVDTNENGRFDSGERYEPNQAVKTIVTNEDGYAQTPEKYLPYGSYTIKETKAPEGYLLDEIRGAKTSLDFTISEEGQVITKYWSASNTEDTMYNAPIRGGFKFEKKDAETRKNTPLGGANLQGTFAVVNKSKSYVWVDNDGNGAFSANEKFRPGDQIFTFTTDAHNGTYETKSNILLPYGTYEIRETKAPTGYLKLPSKAVTFSIRNEKEKVDLTNDKAIYNYVKRGDLYFQKKTATGSKDAGKASKMAHIPFRITAYDQDGKEIESHVVYTDDNGIYDSRTSYVKHAYKTNAGDKAYAESKDGTTSFRGHVGTWFGVGSTANDNLRLNTTGAFPYGKYKIEELECAANKGYDMFVDTFVINHEEATDITMETDPEDAEGGLHGNPDFGTIYNYRMSINPEVTVKSTGEHTSPVSDDVELDNKVEYSNLNVDEKYTIKAYVYDAETNTPIKDKDGKPVVITKSFTASSDNGTKHVDIDLDAEALGLGGKTIVIYNEVVKDKTGKVVASHNDPTDTDMQIRFPDVATQGVSKNTGIGIEKAKKDVTLVDTVSYKAFEKGKKYTLKTRLYDKTADKYVALSGAESAKETVFTADNTSGSVKVEVTIDASDLENHSLVFYEEVYKGSNVYAKHVNKNAAEQTVRFPKIILAKQAAAAASAQSKGLLAKVADFFGLNANADDEEGSPSMAYAGKDAVYSKSVKCENLVPGQVYTLTVSLINPETKEQVKDASGKAVDQTITFTAKSETETQKVKFTFDATGMAGKTINTDASLKIKGYEIAEYIGTEKTALHIPSVKTDAVGANGTKYVKAEKNASIKDTVTYTNVLAGEYTVKGTLVDAETGKTVSTAEAKFKAEKANGTATVTFTADTSCAKGKTLVVYEDIYYGDTLVAQHKDAKDKAQSVTVVALSGNVYDAATKTKQISMTEKAKATDEVTYEGLVKGEKYTLTGTVSDKETGKKVAESVKEFTAENTSGKVTLEYEINAPANAGRTLSVSEALKGIVSSDSGVLYVGNVTGSKAAIGGKKTAEASANTVISDCVSYDNLLKGSSYRAEAMLYDNETGKPLTRKCGKAVSGSAEFTASDSKGTVSVSVNADTSDLAGKKILVFEKIYMGDIVVAYHDGKASDDNTVTITEKKPDPCDQPKDTADQTKDTSDQTKDTADQAGKSDTCDQVKDTSDQAKDTADQTKKPDTADQTKKPDTADQTKKPDTADQTKVSERAPADTSDQPNAGNTASAGTNTNANANAGTTADGNANTSDRKTGLDAILSLIKGLAGIADTSDKNAENSTEDAKDTADQADTADQTENSDEDSDGNDESDSENGSDNTSGSTRGNEGSSSEDNGADGVSQRSGYSEAPSSVRESGRNAKSKDTGDYNHIAVYAIVAVAAAAAIAIVLVFRRKRS